MVDQILGAKISERLFPVVPSVETVATGYIVRMRLNNTFLVLRFVAIRRVSRVWTVDSFFFSFSSSVSFFGCFEKREGGRSEFKSRS